MKKLLSIALLSVGLAGCIHLNPKFRSEGNFEGLEKKFEAITSTSIAGDSILYCFIIHGIGHQDQNYSYTMIDQLGKNLLGKKYKKDSITDLKKGQLEKHHLYNEDLTKRIVFYSITWSPLSDPYKDSLRELEFCRPPYNWNLSEKVKDGVMIDRAGDLFFAQHSKVLPEILTIIDSAFNDMMKEDLQSTIRNLNIISGSLGSQVFLKYLKLRYANFDSSIRENLADEEVKLFEDEFGQESFLTQNTKDMFISRFFVNGHDFDPENAGVLNFYMLTNQVNLMPDNLESWGGIKFNNDHVDTTKLCFEKANFVAFRNPNDMLSYYLPKDVVVNEGKCNPYSTQVTNLYYWNFLVRNNIISAHTVPFKLKKMHKVLAYGSEKQKGVYKWVKVK